jgi:hypothetical protein
MRNFKDIILEKLKISSNSNSLPYLEDFEEALFNMPGHKVYFKDVDEKYVDSNNLPELQSYCETWKITSLFEAKRLNGEMYLFALFSTNPGHPKSRGKDEMVTSMQQLVRLIGEDLVLQIWDYMNR